MSSTITESTYFVVWNSHAGTARNAQQFRAFLENQPHVTIHDWCGEEGLSDVLKTAAEQGFHYIIAAGGDGTVGSIAAKIYELEMTLQSLSPHAESLIMGVLPMGTGNDFSRSLGMPLTLTEAWECLTQAQAEPCDLLRVKTESSERLVLNMVTAGNTGRYLENLTDDLKERWGPLCYLRGVVDVVANLTTYDAEILLDEQPLQEQHWLNVFIANGKFSGGGNPVLKDASPCDGKLNLLAIADGDPVGIASLPGSYLFGDDQHELVHTGIGTEVQLRMGDEWPCTADGESFFAKELSVSVIPGALKILRPAVDQNPSWRRAGYVSQQVT